MLLPQIQSSLFEKRSDKKNLIIASGPGRGKIVFALLYEVEAIHVKLILVVF